MNELKHKRLFLLDMDGTIYLDDLIFDKCLEFLQYIKDIGGRYLFLTNNSSKSVNNYVEKLQSLGIPACYDDFLTSSQATALYLKQNYSGKNLYVFGTNAFKEELKNSGIQFVDSIGEKPLEDKIAALVMGFDTELSFKKLSDACILLNKNVDYIATNPDLVCPTYYGYVPDCGSVTQMLYNATKRMPIVIGKPQKTMVELAISKTGFSKAETVLIGDRIYTDIACGVNAGVSTILVLSGESTLDDVRLSPQKPEYIFDNISKILKSLVED